jgi:hypothetical protein
MCGLESLSYQIYTNKECEFFPCHKGIKDEEFNCMFCYCPLYFIECPVNVPLLSNGLKDCMECTATHRGKKAWVIVRKYLDKHWEKCSEIT